jgi:glutamate carboxypeptidase
MAQTPLSNIPTFAGEEILAGIRSWVEIETPSHDGAAVNRLVDVVESDLTRIGARTTRTPGRDGYGDILEAHAPWNRDEEPGILILGHLDTVHPIGSLATTHAFRREGDQVFGPGIYDMKAGSYMAYYALQHFVRQGRATPLPVRILYVPEEEVGSPTSRAAIEAAALKSKYVLVMEPARDGGKCVTARKGWGRFDMTITGRASHAGSRPQDGRSAVRELARQILDLEAMTNYDAGITVVVGTVQGGSAPNVVPAEARATIDLRVPPTIDAGEIVERIVQRRAQDSDCTITVTGDINRPAYSKSAGIAALFEHAKVCAAEVGFTLEDTPLTGGVSDGNFPAALGVPTLDGLGADGHGAHALDEQINFSSLVPRVQLLVRLLETLR